ncbi:MAG: hypothetical protein IJW40_11035, partial [Clostridia bacterium]|nr:hypothetical protein [Clostridia bacterium]
YRHPYVIIIHHSNAFFNTPAHMFRPAETFFSAGRLALSSLMDVIMIIAFGQKRQDDGRMPPHQNSSNYSSRNTVILTKPKQHNPRCVIISTLTRRLQSNYL